MVNEIQKRLDAVRKEMAAAGIDALIVPHTDPHQSEYLAPHWEVRRFLSGFTGSAGTLVITANDARLWTDSRYFIQATEQLQHTGITLMKDGLPSTPSVNSWLTSTLPHGANVAIDPRLITAAEAATLREELKAGHLKLHLSFNPIDHIWTDRPALPASQAFIHEAQFAGETTGSKISRLRMRLAQLQVDATLIGALDQTAWLLNLRGADVQCNPVVTCYLYISATEAVIFIDPAKLTPEVSTYLAHNNVKTLNYSSLEQFIETLAADASVLVDFSATSLAVVELLGSRAIDGENPVERFKAIKNAVQAEGFRNAMRRDGAALAQAFMEIENRVAAGTHTTETDVARILRRHRSQQPLFFDESFETIAGYGPHGAIVHYSADEKSDATLQPYGLLLVDSGAQYLDGTTDITRTISLGNPSPREKRDFTLVLKGMIALSMAVFPQGTRGIQLDTLAKQYLWRDGAQYLHGTGHGVGHFLNVHEGPQSIRSNRAHFMEPIEAGMVTSNEPGVYREGLHGVRCENLILTVETGITGDDGFPYLAFETLTLFPFDTTLIDRSLFTAEETQWLNAYHRRVYDEVSPLLDDETRKWLETKTKAI